MYLFQDSKLQPSTIDGYRSAIADKLRNSPIDVSKDGNLTHLLDSFHRDRPKGWREIPLLEPLPGEKKVSKKKKKVTLFLWEVYLPSGTELVSIARRLYSPG